MALLPPGTVRNEDTPMTWTCNRSAHEPLIIMSLEAGKSGKNTAHP